MTLDMEKIRAAVKKWQSGYPSPDTTRRLITLEEDSLLLAVPALVAEVDRLKAENDEAVEVLRYFDDQEREIGSCQWRKMQDLIARHEKGTKP